MLDINMIKKQISKYFILSLIFLFFGFIYEQFSHNIYSSYMIYAFLFPLIMGTIIYIIIDKTKINDLLTPLAMSFYNSSILTFSLGSIIQGVLDIYGTTNKLVFYYLIVGIILLMISLIINIINNIKILKSSSK